MANYDDSRLHSMRRHATQIVGANGQFLDRAYCVSCGRDAGASTPNATHLVVSCDDCVKYGSVIAPPLPEAPASVPRCLYCGAVGTDDGPPGSKWICDPCFAAKGFPPHHVAAISSAELKGG